METLIKKAHILIEALPYIQKLSGKLVVIKYGGNAMLNEDLTQKILQDVTLLKYVGVHPVVVHGGGPEINKLLQALSIEPKFHEGLRITDADTMEVVQMVLTGKINKDITAKLNLLGGKAIGLCGKDANLIEVEKRPAKGGVDLGFVGDIVNINTRLIEFLAYDEYIPVIAPVGVGPDGMSYNINADTVAGEIAARLKAEKLMFLTDIDGIRKDPKDPKTLIHQIGIEEIHSMIGDGSIPKVLGCIHSVEQGVNRTHILDGTIPHPILLEIFTDTGIGTMVVKD